MYPACIVCWMYDERTKTKWAISFEFTFRFLTLYRICYRDMLQFRIWRGSGIHTTIFYVIHGCCLYIAIIWSIMLWCSSTLTSLFDLIHSMRRQTNKKNHRIEFTQTKKILADYRSKYRRWMINSSTNNSNNNDKKKKLWNSTFKSIDDTRHFAQYEPLVRILCLHVVCRKKLWKKASAVPSFHHFTPSQSGFNNTIR